MAVNVKVGLIGALDMLKFKNMAKVREQAIQAAPAKEITGEFSVNKLAKQLHPDFQNLVVKEVIDIPGADAKTFILGREDGAPVPYFRAGMYLALKLNVDGSEISRPYSISSAPKKALEGTYAVTVKANPAGFAADKILSGLKVGDKVVASDPQGTFYYENLRDPKNIIALAGGSGVTPFLSMAHAIADGAEDFNLTLIYGCKNKEGILFEDEFNALAAECPKFKVVYVLEEATEGFAQGFITEDLIRANLPEGQYSIFVSGPEAMMRAMKKAVAGLNLPRRLVRFELMPVTKNVAAVPGYPAEAAGKTFKVKIRQGDSEYTIDAVASEPIQSAIERAGIKAPSRCRSGECGWCRSRCVSGEYFVPEDHDFRRFEDKQFNYIHPCCTFAVSDMEIEVPGEYR